MEAAHACSIMSLMVDEEVMRPASMKKWSVVCRYRLHGMTTA